MTLLSQFENRDEVLTALKAGQPVTLKVRMEKQPLIRKDGWYDPFGKCPYGQPGDVLEISEACFFDDSDHLAWWWDSDNTEVPYMEPIIEQASAIRFRSTIESISVAEDDGTFYWLIGVKP